MGKRLYCGNLPYAATADDVKEIFSEGGRTVVDVHIVMDRETGRPRGFAFVEMASDEEALDAVRELDGRMVQGRPLGVKEARERSPRGPVGPVGPGRGPRPAFQRPAAPHPAAGRPPRQDYGFPPPPQAPVAPDFRAFEPEPAKDYGPPEDVDYRDRGDRGKRGRDRRGGRRRGSDFDPFGW